MATASHKITDFPGAGTPSEPTAGLPAEFSTPERDPSREIRNLIEELQGTVREARRQQRHAEEESGQLRSRLLDLEEKPGGGTFSSSQMKELIRERDMLAEQQAQYGPAISDLKQRLRQAEADAHDAGDGRDAAMRERKKMQRQLDESDQQRTEAFRLRESANRQRDLLKGERDKAMEMVTLAKKNFADAQKAIAEMQKTLTENRQELAAARKRTDGEQAGQITALRQARDGMSAQIKELTQHVSDLEDQLAEAGYAREAAEKIARDSQAQFADIQGVLEATAAGTDAQKVGELEGTALELQNQLAAALEANRTLTENEARLSAELSALHSDSEASPRPGNAAPPADAEEQAHIALLMHERDMLREQLAQNTFTFEAQLNVQAAEVERLAHTLTPNSGSPPEADSLEGHFEKRRLDMIDLNTRLENAHREIRELSASLAEVRLHAKLAKRAALASPPPPPEIGETPVGAPVKPVPQTSAEVAAMRRSYQAFTRDQRQLGPLAEIETHTRTIMERAAEQEQPVLHRVCTAFANLLADLMELPDQISQSTLRTLNQGIEFIALLLSDPGIEAGIHLGDARAYIVDDDANTCATAVDALDLVGVQAGHALVSSAALMELAAKPHDLIILDVHMPDLSGFDLAVQIRAMDAYAETPIFFVTGDATLETRVKSSLRGGTEFITKPFSVQELALKSLKSVITGQLRRRK